MCQSSERLRAPGRILERDCNINKLSVSDASAHLEMLRAGVVIYGIRLLLHIAGKVRVIRTCFLSLSLSLFFLSVSLPSRGLHSCFLLRPSARRRNLSDVCLVRVSGGAEGAVGVEHSVIAVECHKGMTLVVWLHMQRQEQGCSTLA